jgi:hypothetical protein
MTNTASITLTDSSISGLSLTQGCAIRRRSPLIRVWWAIIGPIAAGWSVLHLYRHMRQHRESAESAAVIAHIARLRRQDREDGAEVAGTKPPEMEIGQKSPRRFR